MPINPESDSIEPLKPLLTRMLGRCPSHSTLHRWQRDGVRGVKLETVLVGDRRYSTAAAVSQFIRESTAAAASRSQPGPLPNGQPVRSEDVENRLRAAGLL
jgi:Protein of unknown function (DUF1580)